MDKELEKLNKRFENINETLERQNTRIKQLQEKEDVKEYINLKGEQQNVKKELEELLEQMKFEKMRSCKHLFVMSDGIREKSGQRINKTGIEYCIKCDLTTNITAKHFSTKLKKGMSNIYLETQKNSTRVRSICEIELAKEIFDNLKKEMPDVEEEILVPYLEEEIAKRKEESINKSLRKRVF